MTAKWKNEKTRSAPPITRRDFVGSTLIGSGAALLAAKAPGLISNAQAQTIPAPLTRPQTGTHTPS
jgi:spermidine dehydrogenase